jgi:hypothetical protein
MRTILFIVSALLCGLVMAFASAGQESVEEAAFHAGFATMNAERAEVEDTIRTYNGISARFYATGGKLEGLDLIPAAPLVKRRLFKDISMLKGDGLVMVFDLDRMSFDKVKLLKPIEAEAVTDEVWAVSIQEFETRKPVFNVKAVEVQARYLLYRVPFAGGPERWVVYDVDVYPQGMDIPVLERRPAF